MVIGPLMVELALVSVTKGWLFTLLQTSNPSLAWNKANIIKINDDDAHQSFFYMFLYIIIICQ